MKVVHQLLIFCEASSDRSLLCRYLEKGGHELLIVASAEEALAACGSGRYDLALFEYPGAGGGTEALVGRLRALPACAKMPALLVMSPGDDAAYARAAACGCDDILLRPLAEVDVQTRVETALSLSRSREALEEEAKFEGLFGYLADAVLLLDERLNVTKANPRARDLFELGSGGPGIFFPDRIAALYRLKEGVDASAGLEQEACFDLERPETEKTRPLVLELKSQPIRSPLGGSARSGTLVMLSDVTALRQRQYKEEQFLNFISHKLQTPLAIVHKNAKLFSQEVFGPLSDTQRNFMRMIVEKSEELVDSFEKLIRLMAVRNDPQPQGAAQDTDIPRTIAEEARRVIGREGSREVELLFSGERPGLVSRMDRRHLELVVRYLVENAIKFCEEKAVKLSVSIAAPENGFVRIAVADNGPGIPAEERENIFKAFYQIDKFRTGNVKGTGLGLAIVQHLVTLYQGEIGLRPGPGGRGSEFSFTVPLAGDPTRNV